MTMLQLCQAIAEVREVYNSNSSVLMLEEWDYTSASITTKSSDSNPENKSGQLSARPGDSSCTERGLCLCTI